MGRRRRRMGGRGEGGFRWWGKGKDQKGIDR